MRKKLFTLLLVIAAVFTAYNAENLMILKDSLFNMCIKSTSSQKEEENYEIKYEERVFDTDLEDNTGDHNEVEEYFLTRDEIKAMTNISIKDKAIGLSILQRLNKQDIDAIMEAAKGGITYGEMDDVKRILKRRLSSDEAKELESMIDKNIVLYRQGKF